MGERLDACTYFDANYLPRGLALYRSIKEHHADFRLFVLALDQPTRDILAQRSDPGITVIGALDDPHALDDPARRFSDRKQLYFSLTPGLCLHVMRRYPDVRSLVYLDADVFLFDSLDALLEEAGDASVAICPHRRSRWQEMVSRHYGTYNVGVNLFRNDAEGLRCLEEWKHACDDWRPDDPDNPLPFFSDQIYLDSWPARYASLKVIAHPGIDTGPWNAVNHRFSRRDGRYLVDGVPLVAYHFAFMERLAAGRWRLTVNTFPVNLRGTLLDIHRDYLRVVESCSGASTAFARLRLQPSPARRALRRLLALVLNDEVVLP